jgi:hypothetical protein
LRTRADGCCNVHPLIAFQGPRRIGEWRGPQTRELELTLPADPPAALEGDVLSPTMARAGAPEYGRLSVSSCGLRATGVALGTLSSQIAVYADEQHLMAWQRQPAPAMAWPDDSVSPAMPPSRVRIERDGSALDAARWQAGFDDLDRCLLSSLSRLAVAWERESGVTQARVSAEPRVMCGTAGITWGWAEAPGGLSMPPYHRVAGQMDLLACRLDLRLSGSLALLGSSSKLLLGCVASEPLKVAFERLHGEADLQVSLQSAQTRFSQPFTLALESTAPLEATLLGVAGPVQGALVGGCGLRPRADGVGLQWFVTLEVEPVSVLLHWHDPLLGEQELHRPLLPAIKLLDWSLG